MEDNRSQLRRRRRAGSPEQSTLFEITQEPVPDRYPTAFLERSADTLQLLGLEIDGLKGFDNVTISLLPFTILTGPNNSGKSTILQAIAVAFECLRRCLDTDRWQLKASGRAVAEFEFLPVNSPKDLWYKQIWMPARDRQRPVRVGLTFSNGFSIVFKIRFMYGFLNLQVESATPEPNEALLKAVVAASPVLLPATPGPSPHEQYVSLAQVHRLLSILEPNRVTRNVLWQLQNINDDDAMSFVSSVLHRYFGVGLEPIIFDEVRDLELRAPYKEEDYVLDVVSAGSGLNQILQIASVIAWKKPGIVLLDEPDAHLHSSVQAQLLDFLMELVNRFRLQVILATHSRDLIGQAPLQSIVPVDKSRPRLQPLASIDHLLLEYQRQGVITNVELALLYQTKKCVFVEGPSDAKLLPRIAKRLNVGVFLGREQAVLFEFGGVDNLRLLPRLVQLFEALVGTTLRWGVVRDSDANVPEVKEHNKGLAAELKIPNFHQWSTYSIENLLLQPGLLQAAIARKRGAPTSVEVVSDTLARAIERIEPDVTGTFITRAQIACRAARDDAWLDVGVKAATQYLSSLKTLQDKLAVYPGKKMFGAFVEILQAEQGVNLRIEDVIAELNPGNAPDELVTFFEMLKQI
jgi:predicted ATPase